MSKLPFVEGSLSWPYDRADLLQYEKVIEDLQMSSMLTVRSCTILPDGSSQIWMPWSCVAVAASLPEGEIAHFTTYTHTGIPCHCSSSASSLKDLTGPKA